MTSSISPSSHLDNGARQGEQNSFKCMVTLLDRASQASAFLAVLSGNHFSLIAERLTQEQQLQLSQMKFRDFVLKPDSVNLSKELVNGLIEVLTIFNMPIEPVIDTLTKTSPKYFSHKDQFKLLGFQFLQFAKQTQNAIEQADLLDLATEVSKIFSLSFF